MLACEYNTPAGRKNISPSLMVILYLELWLVMIYIHLNNMEIQSVVRNSTIIIFISLSYNSLVWGRGLQGAGYAADVDDADRQYWHPHTVNAISISIFIDLINTSAVYMLDIHITVLLQYYGLSWWYFTYCVRFYSHENNGKLYNTFSYALPQ